MSEDTKTSNEVAEVKEDTNTNATVAKTNTEAKATDTHNLSELDLLRLELEAARKRLNDFVSYGHGGLPFHRESLLFHELSSMARQPPYTKTNRRNNTLSVIEFPEGITFNPSISRPIAEITDEMREKTKSYNFAALEMDPSTMLMHWFVMFQELDLMEKCNVSPVVLREFFTCMHNSYRDNTYHNFFHAMDVAQFSFAVYMNSSSLKVHLTPLDMFCALILGLAHDLDHPGVNNDFLIKIRDPVALLYNSTSVLENTHSASLFLLMNNRPTCDVLANLPADQLKQARRFISRGILATDMSRHFKLIKAINDVPPLADTASPPEDDRLLMLDCIAKSADLCHLVRPWPIAKAWEDRVMEEFFEQGDQEKEMGMSPMDLFNREKCNVPGSQCWFYVNMGKPLFDALHRHVPETDVLIHEMMEKNLPKWKEILQEEKKKKEEEEKTGE
eukprot:m.60259 g.60259  ORF g.60259 m.60259 type:complete len:446 (-) comp11360_c0_seq5:125-1462(-)